jgi:putative aldouronate transport system permease protein
MIVYPLYFIVIASLSDPSLVLNGRVFIIIKGFQLEGYKRILDSQRIWTGYANSLKYTVLATTLNVVLTMMFAYPLSLPYFKARRVIMLLMVFTMYFSGGLIPTYLVVDSLGLTGKWPVMIVLGAVSAWNVIISRTYISVSIPSEMQDSAKIDGCSDFSYLFRIVFPLSKALLAVLCLYYALGHWNGYFYAMIYLKNKADFPIQLILREILTMAKADQEMLSGISGFAEQVLIAESIKYGLVVIASLPLLVAYPFLQKYFVKGVMLGSIKG